MCRRGQIWGNIAHGAADRRRKGEKEEEERELENCFANATQIGGLMYRRRRPKANLFGLNKTDMLHGAEMNRGQKRI